MSTRLKKINEEIKRIEKRIALLQDQLKGAIQRRKLIENEEIVRSFRTLKLDHKELSEIVAGLQNGSIGVSDIKRLAKSDEKVPMEEPVKEQNKEESEAIKE